MSLYQAAYLLAALILFVLATRRGHVQVFLALLLATVGFGYAAGMSTSHVGKAFGLGFAQSLNSLGLIVVAGAILMEIADATGATTRLQNAGRGWRTRSAPLAVIGLIAGVASTPAAAFAVLNPLRRGIGADTPRSALVLGLSLSGSHGLLIPAPVMLASATILAADWTLTLAYGLPVAIFVTLLGAALSKSVSGRALPTDTVEVIDGASLHAPRRGALALIVTSAVLVGMLVVQSLGDIASEPLGGGSNREFLIAMGRPVIILLVGTALLLVLSWHWERRGFAEDGWAGRGLVKAASLLLLVGAAGGLQKIAQETGMAEMNAERLLGWQPRAELALLLAFALAAIVKTLQGSSLVAAITASGMMMALLGPLGLDDPNGRALAALAVGVGAMTVSHINDGLFWLVSTAARLTPGAALARFSLSTALQGVLAIAALLVLRFITI